MRVEAGQQLFLSLHLFNTNSSATLDGESAIEVVTIPESAVVEEAEAILAGTLSIIIPPRATDFEVQGSCTQRRAQRILSLMPHMHQFAVHQTVTLDRSGAGADEILYDADYTFDDQRYRTFDPPIETVTGDVIRVSCFYDNPTSGIITFGESSNTEMCFTGLYRVPASSAGVTCSG